MNEKPEEEQISPASSENSAAQPNQTPNSEGPDQTPNPEESKPSGPGSGNGTWEIERWESLRDVCRGLRPNRGEFDEDDLFFGPGIRPGMYD